MTRLRRRASCTDLWQLLFVGKAKVINSQQKVGACPGFLGVVSVVAVVVVRMTL